MRALIQRWKLRKGCVECGYKTHAVALHLDHIDKKTKHRSGNHKAIETGWSKERIKQELTKCQVLCANCHSVKTYNSKDYLSN